MTRRLGSPAFLGMFPTVVWTLQLDEEATPVINPAILRRLADIRASVGGSSRPAKAGNRGTRSTGLMNSDLVEVIQATTRKVLSFLKIASDDFQITGCLANVNAGMSLVCIATPTIS